MKSMIKKSYEKPVAAMIVVKAQTQLMQTSGVVEEQLPLNLEPGDPTTTVQW